MHLKWCHEKKKRWYNSYNIVWSLTERDKKYIVLLFVFVSLWICNIMRAIMLYNPFLDISNDGTNKGVYIGYAWLLFSLGAQFVPTSISASCHPAVTSCSMWNASATKVYKNINVHAWYTFHFILLRISRISTLYSCFMTSDAYECFTIFKHLNLRERKLAYV